MQKDSETATGCAISEYRPFAFLSSATADLEDLRDSLFEVERRRLWIAERHRPDLKPDEVSPFVVLDALSQQARQSRTFICVLHSEYGASVLSADQRFRDQESVSFLEAEICIAALSHMNMHIFLVEPFSPTGKLRDLLELVKIIRPDIVPVRSFGREAIKEDVRRVLDREERRSRKESVVEFRKFIAGLAARQRRSAKRIEFFDAVFRPLGMRPDKEKIDYLLGQITGEMPRGQQLSRLWVALRELSSAPYDDVRFAEYRVLWEKALRQWSSASAWYGLHGHCYAGRLAATNSVLSIRERSFGDRTDADAVGFIHGTRGAVASEYYSIAKLLPKGVQRADALNDALTEVDVAIATAGGDTSGYLAIRGHIQRMRGKLRAAESDFRSVLSQRQGRGDAGGIGEAEVDLGTIMIRRGRPFAGHRLIMEGAQKLADSGRIPFLARAKKRLAISCLLTCRPLKALSQLCERYELACKYELFGQISRFDELIYALAIKTGVRERGLLPRRGLGG